jgi:cytochrome oxidase Cu insertion factor (SCO1/SenC/PrrC family)
MRKALKAVMAAGLLAGMLAPSAYAQAAQPKAPAPPPKIKVGDKAPDFTLLAYDGSGPPKPVSLKDYRGKKNVALAFYVFAFTGG